MNRKQRMAAQFPKGKQAKPKITPYRNINNSNSQEILDSLEPAQLIGGINKLIIQLRKSGVEIYDWDDKNRKIFKIQRIHGKFYFLADEN